MLAPALVLNVPVALPPLLKRRLLVAAVAVPLLLKVRARVELPAPADLVSKPVLLKVELAPPLRVRSFWIVKLPELLMVEVVSEIAPLPLQVAEPALLSVAEVRVLLLLPLMFKVALLAILMIGPGPMVPTVQARLFVILVLASAGEASFPPSRVRLGMLTAAL